MIVFHLNYADRLTFLVSSKMEKYVDLVFDFMFLGIEM